MTRPIIMTMMMTTAAAAKIETVTETEDECKIQ